MKKLLVLHGPNLNYLDKREPSIYGTTTLAEIDASLMDYGQKLGYQVTCFQSNHEGALVDQIYEVDEAGFAGIIFNPGAYTHTSIALRDCIEAVAIPVIEVHLSNIYAREPFRHHSFISAVAVGQILGFGAFGYQMAIDAINNFIKEQKK